MKNVGHAALALKNRPRSRTRPRPKDRVDLKARSVHSNFYLRHGRPRSTLYASPLDILLFHACFEEFLIMQALFSI